VRTLGSRTLLVLALVLAGLPLRARAQSEHYWLSQFGNRSRLLGGAVIGGVNDLSATFYNPGALALLDEPQFLLSGNVYQYTSLQVQDGLGVGRDLGAQRVVGIAPLFAGRINFGFLGKHHLAYSFITRQNIDLRIDDRLTLPNADVFGIPNPTFSQANVRVEQRLNEYWAGLTWAYPLGEHVGVGATLFGAAHGQTNRQELVVQSLGAGGQAGLALQAREFYFQHVRLLIKAGVNVQEGPWSLGANFTTAGLGLYGVGESGIDNSLVSQGTAPARIVSNFQNQLPASYKSPWSVGVGVSRSLGKEMRAHISAEWFAPVDAYTVLNAQPFVGQSTGQLVDTDVRQSLKSVLNFGIGVEQRYSENLNLYLSFHTDRSASPGGNDISSALASWDLYHFATGASFKVGRYDFTLGGVFAFGDTEPGSNLEFVPGDPLVNQLGGPGNSRIAYYNLSLVLGVTLQRSKDSKTQTSDVVAPDAPAR
jgi:hypothetical protein